MVPREVVDSALHRVTQAVVDRGAARWPATPGAELLTVACLIGLVGDGAADPAAAQVGAVPAGGVRLIGTVGWQLSVLAGAARDVWAVCSDWECFDKRDACTASADSSSVVIPCRGSSRSQEHLPISRSRGALHESEDPGNCWGHGQLMGWCARERFY